MELQVRKHKYHFRWMSNSILTLERQTNLSNFKSVLFKSKIDVHDKTNNGFLLETT